MRARAPHVVVVGAGITGLTTAYRLRQHRPEIRITVVEGSTRPGGKIVTDHVDGFVIEGGPDSIVTFKPQATVCVAKSPDRIFGSALATIASLGNDDRASMNCQPYPSAISNWRSKLIKTRRIGRRLSARGTKSEQSVTRSLGLLSTPVAGNLSLCRHNYAL